MTSVATDIARALDAIIDGTPAEERWAALEDSGFLWLDDDGVGLAESVAVAGSVGRACLAEPLVETTGLVSWLLRVGGLARPDGLTLPTVADPRDDLRATVLPGGAVEVSGTVHRVPWGRRADHLVTVADVGPQRCVLVLPRPPEFRAGENMAHEPRDTFLIDRVRVPASAVGTPAPTTVELRARGALLRAASAAAAMDRVLTLVRDHAATREQFGTPIRTFGAVQQHIAEVVEAAAASALAVRAAVLADPAERVFAAAAAALTTKEDATRIARSAHQVFGAVGVTEEHALPAFTTRLWSWQDEFGDADEWAGCAGRAAFGSELPTLWSLISTTRTAFTGRALGETVPWSMTTEPRTDA